MPLPKIGRRPALAADRRTDASRRAMPTTAAPSSSAPAATRAAAATACKGQGQWVGPDLSTIGTKYGKDELLRSILNPSAAIGYSFRSLVLALADGRVVTGLPVEESTRAARAQDGRRQADRAVRTGEIEERRTSDVSLMPEGLAQTMTDQELVDLLAFLTTLQQPVSIVGQYHVVGPVSRAAHRRFREDRPGSDACADRTESRTSPGAGSRPTPKAWPSLPWRPERSGERSVYAYTTGLFTGRATGEARGRDPVGPYCLAWRKARDLAGPTQAAIEPHEAGITLPKERARSCPAERRRPGPRGRPLW